MMRRGLFIVLAPLALPRHLIRPLFQDDQKPPIFFASMDFSYMGGGKQSFNLKVIRWHETVNASPQRLLMPAICKVLLPLSPHRVKRPMVASNRYSPQRPHTPLCLLFSQGIHPPSSVSKKYTFDSLHIGTGR